MSETPTTPDRFCMYCGYCLRGLSENQCPECGEAFDPSDDATWTAEPTEWSTKLLLYEIRPAAVLFLAVFGGLGLGYLVHWIWEWIGI